MNNFQDFLQADERGTSIVEFLILAPFLTFLMYGVFFLHEHVSDGIDASINNRLALFQGIIPVFPQTSQKNLNPKDEVKVVESMTRLEYGRNRNDGSNLISSHVGETSKAFDQTYAAIDQTSAAAVNAAEVPRQAFYTIVDLATGIKVKESLRIAHFESKSNFDKSDLMHGLLTLEHHITNKPSEAHEFHHIDRLYLNELNNYHPSSGIRSALSGYVIGLAKHKHWGSHGDFSKTSDHFVTRCMARLTQEFTCENSQKGFGSRTFAYKLSVLIAAKVAVSAVVTVFTFGFGTAVEEAMIGAIRELISSVVEDHIKELVKGVMEKMIIENLPNLNNFSDFKFLEKQHDELEKKFGLFLSNQDGVK